MITNPTSPYDFEELADPEFLASLNSVLPESTNQEVDWDEFNRFIRAMIDEYDHEEKPG